MATREVPCGGSANAGPTGGPGGETGLRGMAERPVLPRKPGNAGGGKGPWFKDDAGRSEGEEIGVSLELRKGSGSFRGIACQSEGRTELRFLVSTTRSIAKDVLSHGWNCCRANGGGAGVDGQSFEQIEAWGLERWVGGIGGRNSEEDL